MPILTRKELLKKGTIIAGSAALAGVYGIFSNTGWGDEIKFIETVCGRGDSSGKKILIAYASMYGTTGEVAKAIALDLCRSGAIVDIRLVKNVRTIRGYDSAIIGSAVRSEKWLPEATEFVVNNKEELSKMPVAYFLTCLALAKKSEGVQKYARSFFDHVLAAAPEVKPLSTGMFAGVLDYSKYSVMIGMVMKYKMWAKDIEEGDYRDWESIHEFAGSLKTKLKNTR